MGWNSSNGDKNRDRFDACHLEALRPIILSRDLKLTQVKYFERTKKNTTGMWENCSGELKL